MSDPARRLPFVPTLLVGLALAVMIALGVWQIGRSEEKAALLERYRGAQALSSQVTWPRTREEIDAALYRRSEFVCEQVLETRATAGRSSAGASGWAQVARCALDGGGEAEVALGWSDEPVVEDWAGGAVTGFVAPAGEGARLVAAPPQAGLVQLAPPDPADLPNNHLSYAFQWFAFAVTALVIYALALRRRWRGGD